MTETDKSMLEINISIGFTFCLLSSRHLKQWIHGFNAFRPEIVQHTRIQLWTYSLSRVILAKFTHKTSKLIAGWLCIDICFNISNEEHFPWICFLTITCFIHLHYILTFIAFIPDLVIWVILALEMGGLYSFNEYNWKMKWEQRTSFVINVA